MQISIANIIRGTLIGNTMSVLTRYISRVVNGGGIVEAPQCVETALNSQGLLQQASLLVVPSGYKGGTLYSEIPTNGNGDLTWTRGSDAFRTNASGLIQRVPWNLLQQSETFQNAYWTKTNSTITANTTTAPNGTLTANTLVENNANNFHLISRGTFASGTNTLSIYAKASTRTFAYIALYNGSADFGAYFNLTAGTIGNIDSGVSASIESVGDGWFRCIITFTSTAPVTTSIGVAQANGTRSYTGNGTSGIFIWGAQLVEGTTAQTYLPTTDRLNFPRLSYMYGSCPAVLLEPQRTNLITYSNTFSDSSWAKIASSGGSITITDNYNTSPDGNNNASRFVFNNLNTAYISKSFTSVNSTSYTISIYAKSNTSNSYTFQLRDGYSGSVSGNLTITPTWQRFTWTFTASGTIAEIMFRTTVVASGDISIYGGQAEAGAYPTTYIPTTSATSTRVADTAIKTGISSIINSQQGTLYVNCRTLFNGGSFRGISISDGTYGNRLAIVQSLNANTLLIALSIGGIFIVNQSISGYLQTNFNKIAVSWGSGTLKVFINGSLSNTFTSITMPSANLFTRIGFDAGAPASEFEGFIQQMALYPSPLSDTDCATLTTL